eukprot:scaffold896_cov172-Amphora_coffeaeformis.AAC.15
MVDNINPLGDPSHPERADKQTVCQLNLYVCVNAPLDDRKLCQRKSHPIRGSFYEVKADLLESMS